MSLRKRPTETPEQQQPAASPSTTTTAETLKRQPSRSTASLPQRALSQTLSSTANLANLLPTGTLLAFQLLTPLFTNNGSCDDATRPLTLLLLLFLAASCVLASFTDSVKSSNGQVYYGFATFKGLFLFDYIQNTEGPDHDLPDLSKYRITFIDGVHAVLSVLVFVAVAMRDKNVLSCFYPTPKHETQEVLNIVPVGIGLVSSLLFMVFPTRRHGIGYPITAGK